MYRCKLLVLCLSDGDVSEVLFWMHDCYSGKAFHHGAIPYIIGKEGGCGILTNADCAIECRERIDIPRPRPWDL